MPKRRFASVELAIATVIAMAATVGCANWKSADVGSGSEFSLTEFGQSQSTPLIEVSFLGLKLSTEDQDLADGIWQWVDETRIDLVQRRRLLVNGIRVGFVSNEDQFRRRLQTESSDSDVLDEFLSQVSVKSDLSHGTERLPLRYGRRHELPLRQPIEGTDVTLVRLADGVIGETLQRPQPVLAITSSPATSIAEIELKFRPELQHGEAKQKWISSDSAFRIDTRRDAWSLPELDLDVTASAGDLLVITADTPPHGLGKQMLTGTGPDQAQQQMLLLIEVIQVGRQ